jgi:biopolymer transport protein ExbB
MFELVKEGGWLMLPIILCSVIAAGIILERLWSLQRRRVIPAHLVAKVWSQLQSGALDDEFINRVRLSSPLGRLLAAGLVNRAAERAVMKESIEDTGRHVVHDLDRYLNSLGTIAAISPLLGLLGTVVGLMKVFAAITTQGVGNPAALAGGISEALITTVAGLAVAIPAIIGYRYLRGKVDGLVVEMEQEVIKLIDAVHRQPQRVARAGLRPQITPGRPIPGATGATGATP